MYIQCSISSTQSPLLIILSDVKEKKVPLTKNKNIRRRTKVPRRRGNNEKCDRNNFHPKRKKEIPFKNVISCSINFLSLQEQVKKSALEADYFSIKGFVLEVSPAADSIISAISIGIGSLIVLTHDKARQGKGSSTLLMMKNGCQRVSVCKDG